MELWNKRTYRYHKMLSKYLRYVFNDHFMIAVLFLLGALSLSYSNFLKSLSPELYLWWAKPIVLVVLLCTLQLGTLATLVKPADIVFLLPKEEEMKEYLYKAWLRSMLLSWCSQLLVLFVLVPFLMVAWHFTLFEVILVFILQIGLKSLDLYWQKLFLYIPLTSKNIMAKVGGQILALASCLWVSTYLGILWLLVFLFVTYKKSKLKSNLLWDKMIERENKRLYQVYRFFNLFTDVPYVQSKAKRRKYLDKLLPKAFKVEPYSYLFWRGFFRNGQYSGLYGRLTILGTVILFFVNDVRFGFFIAILFVYLIGFQIMPMYFSYDEIVFTHLYPLTLESKQQAFKILVFKLLSITTLIFSLSSLVAIKNISMFTLMIVILILESYFLAFKYLNLRLKKVA